MSDFIRPMRRLIFAVFIREGKLGESQGRKAMGLPTNVYDCQVATVIAVAIPAVVF